MPTVDPEHLTAQQKKWFASIREGLARDTGKSLQEWVMIARSCPETGRRAQLKWFKDEHGLLQNRASIVLAEAFPSEESWSQPEGLKAALWVDPQSRAVFEAVAQAATALPDVVVGQRKGFSAWSRRYQFAALRPIKGGSAMLGLALSPKAGGLLQAPRNEGWSERLKGRLELASPQAVTPEVVTLLREAWAAS